MIDVIIKQDGNPAKVTSAGELITGPLSYDLSEFRQLTSINTAYNFYEPKAKKQFVIKSIVVFADKDINDATDTIIEIYEATSDTETTVSKTLLTFGMAKLSILPIVPLNLLVNEGTWINAKTNDNNIFLTIMGFYIDVV